MLYIHATGRRESSRGQGHSGDADYRRKGEGVEYSTRDATNAGAGPQHLQSGVPDILRNAVWLEHFFLQTRRLCSQGSELFVKSQKRLENVA